MYTELLKYTYVYTSTFYNLAQCISSRLRPVVRLVPRSVPSRDRSRLVGGSQDETDSSVSRHFISQIVYNSFGPIGMANKVAYYLHIAVLNSRIFFNKFYVLLELSSEEKLKLSTIRLVQ